MRCLRAYKLSDIIINLHCYAFVNANLVSAVAYVISFIKISFYYKMELVLQIAQSSVTSYQNSLSSIMPTFHANGPVYLLKDKTLITSHGMLCRKWIILFTINFGYVIVVHTCFSLTHIIIYSYLLLNFLFKNDIFFLIRYV